MHDKIWFTYKARIQTQNRLTRNDFHSQLLLVWYAVLAAGLSIATIRYPKFLGENTDILSASFGVAVLAMSLFVTNRDFRGRSIEMRRNYLALQELHAAASASPPLLQPAVIHKEYYVLLSAVENHSEIDDKYFRVFQRGALNSRKPGYKEIVEVYAYLAGHVVLLAVAYLFPLTVLVLL